jgi:uncharacterized protein (DUF1330 family)
MPAYLLVNLEVTDSAAFEKYRNEVAAVVRRHGGEYLVRGGNHEVHEGNWRPGRLVLLRFADMKSIKAFLGDPEYQPLKALRQRAAKSDLVAVEGV